jgi:DNA replication protein DnaC
LLGQSGCGKTHLCCAVSNKLIEEGAEVIYMVWNNAVKELKRNATDDETYSKLFDKYANAEVLYIDDFFKGKITEADITIAFEIINYRYNNPDCVTIISSELLLPDLFNVDEAVAGRILERCGENVIQIKPDINKNYRRKMVSNF